MMLNCWIIDDEPLALSLLEAYVQKVPFLKLTGKYSNAISAMENLAHEHVDILFLDIQMPEVSGMEFARIVPSHTRIVFTTAFSQYALEGYKVNALDYLLKPFSFSDFLSAARKAQQWFEMTDKKHDERHESAEHKDVGFFVKSDYKLIHIFYDDILYIEGLKDYVKIYLTTDSKPILSLMALKTLEKELPADRFIRTHRSYIIHKNKIENINKKRICIAGREIPIGETYRRQFDAMLRKNIYRQ